MIPLGVMASSRVEAPAADTLTFRSYESDVTNAAAYSFPAILGPASSSRTVLAALHFRASTGPDLASVTIAGEPATIAAYTVFGTSSTNLTALAYVRQSVGEVGTVDATLTSDALRAGCAVWSWDGPPLAFTAAPSLSGTTPTNGFALAAISSAGSAEVTVTGAGFTVRYNATPENSMRVIGADVPSGTTFSITSAGASSPAPAAAIFFPA